MITISSGHGTKIRGASGPEPWGLDEVDSAIKIMNRTAELLADAGVDVMTFTDTTSTTQSANLDRIVAWHNSIPCDLAVSIHLNAYEPTTSKKMGCECLYVSQEELSAELSEAMSDALDLPDRGAKYRSDLAFLNGTNAAAVLLEALFCDAKMDCDSFRDPDNFEALCRGIASVIAGEPIAPPEPEPIPPEPEPIPPQPTEQATVEIETSGNVRIIVNGREVS